MSANKQKALDFAIGDRVRLVRLCSTNAYEGPPIEGILISDMITRNCVVIDTSSGLGSVDYRRCIRTSRIVAIEDDRVYTINSIYRMESV